ncbi:hypothetical protein SAMN02745866_01408 [Alteromonadaceae bacterium Bs31]|nr:hypothetical protein SAMN02745866_01408 [Alteromonadaceae bacterium Bs31]
MKTYLTFMMLTIVLVFAGAAHARGEDGGRHHRSGKEKHSQHASKSERRSVHGTSRHRHERQVSSHRSDSGQHRSHRRDHYQQPRYSVKSRHHAAHKHYKHCGHGDNHWVGSSRNRHHATKYSWYQWGRGGQCFRVKDKGYSTVWIEVPFYKCR